MFIIYMNAWFQKKTKKFLLINVSQAQACLSLPFEASSGYNHIGLQLWVSGLQYSRRLNKYTKH